MTQHAKEVAGGQEIHWPQEIRASRFLGIDTDLERLCGALVDVAPFFPLKCLGRLPVRLPLMRN